MADTELWYVLLILQILFCSYYTWTISSPPHIFILILIGRKIFNLLGETLLKTANLPPLILLLESSISQEYILILQENQNYYLISCGSCCRLLHYPWWDHVDDFANEDPRSHFSLVSFSQFMLVLVHGCLPRNSMFPSQSILLFHIMTTLMEERVSEQRK